LCYFLALFLFLSHPQGEGLGVCDLEILAKGEASG
jgi:hypothetical protein